MIETIRILLFPEQDYFRSLLSFGLIISIVYFLFYTLLNLASRFVSPSPGAEDNGSAVAIILEVAKYLKKKPTNSTAIWLLFTDGEEIGMRGALEFAKCHKAELSNAWVINIEGGGKNAPLAYSIKEKSLRIACSSSKLIAILIDVAKDRNEQLCPTKDADSTDAYFFLRQGYKAVTLWRYSKESRDAIHTSNDNIDIIDPDSLVGTVEFLCQVIETIDKI